MAAALNVCLFVSISLTSSVYDASCQERVGCFKDTSNRVLESDRRRHSSMTVEWCLNSCFTDRFVFAGLEAGNECFCGNSTYHTKHGNLRNDDECSRRCNGNGNQTCGGSWRLEIYKDLNECLNDNNGGCNQRCVNSLGSYHCTCHTGYELRDGEKLTCADIDECIDGSHRCNQTCKNTPGAYECSCHEGYELIENGIRECTDINECNAINGGCDHSCINSLSSYHCECRDGHILKSPNRTQCEEISEVKSEKVTGMAAGICVAGFFAVFIIVFVVIIIKRS